MKPYLEDFEQGDQKFRTKLGWAHVTLGTALGPIPPPIFGPGLDYSEVHAQGLFKCVTEAQIFHDLMIPLRALSWAPVLSG